MIETLRRGLPPALLASCVATVAVYLGILTPRLRKSGQDVPPPWRYFKTLEAFREISEREGGGRGLWWGILLLTAGDLCLALGLTALRLRDLVSGWMNAG